MEFIHKNYLFFLLLHVTISVYWVLILYLETPQKIFNWELYFHLGRKKLQGMLLPP